MPVGGTRMLVFLDGELHREAGTMGREREAARSREKINAGQSYAAAVRRLFLRDPHARFCDPGIETQSLQYPNL